MISLLIFTTILAFSLKAAAAPAAPALAQAALTSLVSVGNGCPAGSVYSVLSDDKTMATLTFNSFSAEAGPQIPRSDNQRSCNITLGVRVPANYHFGLATIDYRGYYQLDEKVTAQQQSKYYFQDKLTQATAQSAVVGPIPGTSYTYRDNFDLGSTVVSSCGGITGLIINTILQVNNNENANGSGFVATDDLNGTFEQVLALNWQPCKP